MDGETYRNICKAHCFKVEKAYPGPCTTTKTTGGGGTGREAVDYEVWASDQSNTAPGQTQLGVKGGNLWIYDKRDILDQIQRAGKGDAVPLSCIPDKKTGPCNLLEVFPSTLLEMRGNILTGSSLGQLEGFGRLHGVLGDPFGKYVTVNLFTPGGGYVGIMDTRTKEAVALFRVTKYAFVGNTEGTRSVHMSFWTVDGSHVTVANLHGKAVERLNIERDADNNIVDVSFDKSASLGLGKGMSVVEEASVFVGENAFGRPLIGSLIGNYQEADLSDTTPNAKCKEDGCAGAENGSLGGRANNVPICPIPSNNDKLYVTLGGGGLLIADIKSTPMSIVGEYGKNVAFGAGCGGAQEGTKMFLDTGVSASGAGVDQSLFSVFAYDDTAYDAVTNAENFPMPTVVFADPGNTLSIGNIIGNLTGNDSGQIPGETTRRDSHGADITTNGKYLHIVDRIQNNVEVFNVDSYERSTYDLTSKNGKKAHLPGACFANSVVDDLNLPGNDPAPDLFEVTPDGKYMMVAFRGPAPVSVSHSAQGSCPGVGVVQLTQNGKMGRLVGVLRAHNSITDEVARPLVIPGGISYNGDERADVHGCVVIAKSKDTKE